MRKLILLVCAVVAAASAALVAVGALGAARTVTCLAPGALHGDGEYEVVMGRGPTMAAVRPIVNHVAAFSFKNLEVVHDASGYSVKLYGLTNRSLLSQELAEVKRAKLHIVRVDTVYAPCR